MREEKRTAGLLSDFDDYDVGDSGAGGGAGRKSRHAPPRRR
jgi:hypothetical protein